MYVPVAVRSSANRSDKRKGIAVPMLIGSIEIDEWTTVEEARWIIAREMDKVPPDVPITMTAARVLHAISAACRIDTYH
jgi:hypothetical protein